MSLAGSQQRTLLQLIAELRPAWRSDRALPARIQTLIGRQRAFGSRDRRLYRELIYTILRYLPWIEPWLDADAERATRVTAWLAADTPATARFRAEVAAGWPPVPPTLAERAARLQELLPHSGAAGAAYDPAALLPGWFRDACPAAFEPAQLDRLLARAPLWIRLQTDDAGATLAEFERMGWTWERSSVLESALRVRGEADLTRTESYRTGRLEVQDLGSQLVLEAAGVAPGGHWLDACAGAGGKTLQLSRLVGPDGSVDAFDVRPDALQELGARTARAQTKNVRVLRDPPTSAYDGVLVDAPCSGSGTWRRAPHLKWTTTLAHVDHAAERQRAVLGQFGARVLPGGRLVYATCSLCRQENEEVVAAFLAEHPDFAVEPLARDVGASVSPHGMTILPDRHDTDGFFVATLRRRA